MRNELLLIGAIVLVLIADLLVDEDGFRTVYLTSIGLMVIITVTSFFPSDKGELFGGMFRSGTIQMVMKAILNIAALLVLLISWSWLNQAAMRKKAGEFLLLLLSTLVGMSYMISSGHFLMFFLGLELATIPLAAMAAFESIRSKSSEAGIKLILLAAFSSGVLLFGITLLYAVSGSLYFAEVAASVAFTPVVVLGVIFLLSGMAFKVSLVPFHLWTADVYEGAPMPVTAYLSVVSKGAAVFILLIMLQTVFSSVHDIWMPAIYTLTILTITIGNLFALRQQNIKRFLAFSSIAQAGFILLGVLNVGPLGSATVIYFVFVYVFSNLAAFGVAASIEGASGKVEIGQYKGFYTTNPKLSLVMMLAMFSLAGIPPLAGFFGKFFLFMAVAEQFYYTLLIVAVLNTIVSLYYYLIVVKSMLIDQSDQAIPYFKSDLPMRVALIICVVGIVATGFYGGLFDHLMQVGADFISTVL